MVAIPEDLRRKLAEFGQDHILACWDRLAEAEQKDLVNQLCGIDLAQLRHLYAQRDETYAVPAPERICPVDVARLDSGDEALRQKGETLLREGQVAVLLVAGGQGSRLGFEHPKG